ncbi:hypothetical protein BH11PSE4_BH11PSE4_41270 [soil metagenome]
MTRNVVVVAALLIATTAFNTSAVAADKCPVGEAGASNFQTAVTTAVKTAWSCSGAYQTLEACQLGSTADNALSDIVLAKCEPVFLPKATPAIKSAYQKAKDKCSQIAAKKEGSMYQGQAAVCMARAGRDFARKYAVKR